MTKAPNVRARFPLFSLAGILFIVMSTLLGAAANMRPFHIPTAREIAHAEQLEVAQARRARIDVLRADDGDRCRVEVARELARALVFDGQSAVPYADDYERRCGNDHVVRKWGDASRLLASVRRTVTP